MARISEDNTSYRASGIERRDFRHTANGPEVTGKPRKRKDKRRWCKGVEGREHVLATVLNDPRGYGCGWLNSGYLRAGELIEHNIYICHHEVKCEDCGKVLDGWLGEKCPDLSQG